MATLSAAEIRVLLSAKDEITTTLGNVEARIGTMEQAVAKSTSTMGGMGNALGLLKGAVAAVGIYSFTQEIAGFVSKGFEFNSMIESSTVAFKVLLGSSEAAQGRIAELYQFAATTPFEFGEVAQASRILQTFTGDVLSTGEGLRLVGDIASGTQRPFAEVAMWIGRMYDALKSGRPFGEAAMRLQEMGALSGEARARLEALAASGEDISVIWPQAAAEFDAFSGMMIEKSATMEGRMSTFNDAVAELAGTITNPLFTSARDALPTITDWVSALNAELKETKPSGDAAGNGMAAFAIQVARAVLVVPNAIDALRMLKEQMDAFGSKSDEIAASSRRAIGARDMPGDAMKDMENEAVALAQALADLAAEEAAVAVGVTAVTAAVVPAAAAVSKAGGAVREAREQVETFEQALNKLTAGELAAFIEQTTLGQAAFDEWAVGLREMVAGGDLEGVVQAFHDVGKTGKEAFDFINIAIAEGRDRAKEYADDLVALSNAHYEAGKQAEYLGAVQRAAHEAYMAQQAQQLAAAERAAAVLRERIAREQELGLIQHEGLREAQELAGRAADETLRGIQALVPNIGLRVGGVEQLVRQATAGGQAIAPVDMLDIIMRGMQQAEQRRAAVGEFFGIPSMGGGQTNITIEGPVYGLDDLESRLAEIWSRQARQGNYDQVLNLRLTPSGR